MTRHLRSGDGSARRIAGLPDLGRMSTLDRGARVRRNVKVDGRRTSVSLEVAVWDALVAICRAEGLALDTLCSDVGRNRSAASLASGLRIFALTYFRSALEDSAAAAGPLEVRAGKPATSGYRRILDLFRRSRRRNDNAA